MCNYDYLCKKWKIMTENKDFRIFTLVPPSCRYGWVSTEFGIPNVICCNHKQSPEVNWKMLAPTTLKNSTNFCGTICIVFGGYRKRPVVWDVLRTVWKLMIKTKIKPQSSAKFTWYSGQLLWKKNAWPYLCFSVTVLFIISIRISRNMKIKIP